MVEGVETGNGGQVFGVVDEIPTGGNCIIGVTQVTIAGTIVAQTL